MIMFSLLRSAAMGSAFIGISLLGACSNAADKNIPRADKNKINGVKTICLERFVLDIPDIPDIGASSPKLDDGYGVPGVHSNGTSVPKWSGMEIVETHAVSEKALQSLRTEIDTLYNSYRSGLDAHGLDKKIEEYRRDIEDIPADDKSASDMAHERIFLDLLWEKFSINRPAEPKLSANEYAYRKATLFHVGFHDPIDRRIRMFKGQPLRTDTGTAKEELDRMRSLYRTRAPTEIPTAAGFCTGFGFIHEPDGPEEWTDFETPFRSSAYPNLIFNLSIQPSRDDSKRGAPPMRAVWPYFANMNGLRVRKFHGPVETTLAGSPARLFGMLYDSRCKEEPCVPLEDAYEFVVETYGEPGRPEFPHIKLKMVAALYDGHKLKLDYGPGREWMKKAYKPGLRGLRPPPYEVGLAVFESVAKSFRLRPGAIASNGKAPASAE